MPVAIILAKESHYGYYNCPPLGSGNDALYLPCLLLQGLVISVLQQLFSLHFHTVQLYAVL